ncbi:fluoride efflux transporter CrcB [Apirhabdus apintestini]|nr:fluoride efflux transporter CrcB [Enterobacteriaceae bacterium CA-0114]
MRWALSNRLNALFPSLPPGTLVANILAGLIIGAALPAFIRYPGIDPALRLLITTGICGGLSTFSTFSLEIFVQLQSGNWLWAIGGIAAHVALSLLAVGVGFALANLIIS